MKGYGAVSRHMFGWSYPPGAANDPYAPWNQEDGPCAVCAKGVEDCICPECPACGETGNPSCYTGGHGALKIALTREQVISRQEARILQLRSNLQDEEMCLEYLKQGGEFSDALADNPDPWG